MKKLRFVYEMRLDFTIPVIKQHFLMHCRPRSGDGQLVNSYEYMLGEYDEMNLYSDSFGNMYFAGRVAAAHQQFDFSCRGIVWTGIGEKQRKVNPVYKYISKYTACGEALQCFYKENYCQGYSNLHQAEYFMNELYNSFSYVKGATDTETTAETAMALGKGVCQDYAHIMLALCRRAGIPAKYAAGLMIGEGESHAWLEIYDGNVWVGIDPTHNCLINDDYIKFAEGRDYQDCLLNRGLFCGMAAQTQKIYANVEEIL